MFDGIAATKCLRRLDLGWGESRMITWFPPSISTVASPPAPYLSPAVLMSPCRVIFALMCSVAKAAWDQPAGAVFATVFAPSSPSSGTGSRRQRRTIRAGGREAGRERRELAGLFLPDTFLPPSLSPRPTDQLARCITVRTKESPCTLSHMAPSKRDYAFPVLKDPTYSFLPRAFYASIFPR